jgi:hypothetical protein
VDSSMRYFGCLVGFAFGVLWMTIGLGSAIVCALLAAFGYGAVFVAERGRANASAKQTPADALALSLDGFDSTTTRRPLWSPRSNTVGRPADKRCEARTLRCPGMPRQRTELRYRVAATAGCVIDGEILLGGVPSERLARNLAQPVALFAIGLGIASCGG